MTRFLIHTALFALAAVSFGCSNTAPVRESSPSGQPHSVEQEPIERIAEFTILQLNDVYEITPVEGGKRGGLARVATLRRRLLTENPNTYTMLAGDFLSPSALGTAKVDGERLAGKQMVAVLNAVGIDFVTFGNHEFDLKPEQFYARLDESNFEYVSGNVFDENGVAFPGVVPYRVIEVPAPSGDTLRLGVLGITAPITKKDYVSYKDHLEIIKQQVDLLKGKVDVIVAMTHLFMEQDVALAKAVPELDLIMGGHDHENVQVWRGPDLTPIAKADANVRSVYIHRLRYDFETAALETDVRLQLITDDIPDDPGTAAVVDEWLNRAWDGFRQSGFKPEATVATISEPLDGRESAVRNHPTGLTRLIVEGMRHAAGNMDVAMFNSGSIRIDDVILPGKITEYDIIRVMPFGGEVLEVEMSGTLLDSVLTQGLQNKGLGGYLQFDGAAREDAVWRIGDADLMPTKTYRVAINDFLISGRESNLGYLTLNHPGINKIAEHGDIRMAVIAELQRAYP